MHGTHVAFNSQPPPLHPHCGNRRRRFHDRYRRHATRRRRRDCRDSAWE